MHICDRGVISSLSNGIAAASIGKFLEVNGLKVAFMKLDPLCR
ncbi:MAG: hypothetical protein COX41_01915 [Candidatus Omnitrophica bacterium CG23_combo_of_CG06-09_8_20_14_all_41_10]|uniref:CTP synthase N-terminal domain-containing protein n=1 Tax=Candidatus Sherwoodlollariibacterium unditelluris TaxID=1974757 RepID=A0A2G9YK49_9BACT|nr:MAG: hypothetical protein COX41_01915 [Candidatus Omnitrophica bacterium CG23_combo_of_CG06-09_8_20_14_all_41_10]